MEIFVPGRLCLFGEHSDWASLYKEQNPDISSGNALVLLLDLGIFARAELNSAIEIMSTVHEGSLEKRYLMKCEADLTELQTYVDGNHFFAYAASICQYMMIHHQTGGILLDNYKTTLPIKKGLASSASFSVLLVKAFNWLYQLGLDADAEREIAFLCENNSHSRCGRMDHACAYQKSIMHLTFHHDMTVYKSVHAKKDIHIVIVDLNGMKNTKKILDDLNDHFPFPKNKKERSLHRFLGIDNEKTVKKAVSFLEKGKTRKLGKLMLRMQREFDEKVMCFSEELNSPILHSLLKDKNVFPFIYGGKGVGSHGDGCAQFIARDKKRQEQLVDYLVQSGYSCYPVVIKKESNQ